MAFPRVGQSTPSTPHGHAPDLYSSLTTRSRHRRTKPVSVSVSHFDALAPSESECLPCSPSSTASSSISRVDQAISRINSLSSHGDAGDAAGLDHRDRDDDGGNTLRASAASSTTAASTASTGRTPVATGNAHYAPQRPYSPLPTFGSPLADRTNTPGRSGHSGHRFTRSVGAIPFEVESSPNPPPTTGWVKPELPGNPALWTPSELAQHLAYTLRTGGPDGQDPTLPAAVIEDVISWVLRSRITGAQFLRGIDAQRGSRPPPFLPVLSTLSRRMRRTLRHRRSSDAFSEADVFNDSGDDSDGVTRVKRLAHAFDAISSCSEASEVGDAAPSLSALRAQITGENVTGYGRATPKTEAQRWSRGRRDSSISAMSSVSLADSALSGISAVSAPLWRMRAGSYASSAAGAATAVASWAAQQCATPLERPESPVATMSLSTKANGPLAQPHEGSPPPPYPLEDKADGGMLFPPAEDSAPGTPDVLAHTQSRSTSLTPLNVSQSRPSDADVEAHLLRMVAHKAAGIDPYRVLRRGAKPDRRTSGDHMLHPSGADTPTSPTSASPTRARGASRKVSREVAALTERIRELEARLVAVETSTGEEQHEIVSAQIIEIDEDELHEVEPLVVLPDAHTSPTGDPGTLCPNCCKAAAAAAAAIGFPTPIKGLDASTSTRLSSSTSSCMSSGSVLRASCLAAASAAAAERELSPAASEATDATAVDGEVWLGEGEGALVPAGQFSWLALLGLVDEYGTEPRYRDLPVYLFLMGVGVGVGFSAVVVKLMLGKRAT